MSSTICARIRRTSMPLFVMTALVLPACNSLLDTTQDLAEQAVITVEGTSAVPLMLVLSNQYIGSSDPSTGEISITLLAADTLVRTIPLNTTYPLGDQARILVRLINPDTIETASVRLRILLDGVEEVYNKEATLRDAYLEYRFAYY